MWGVYGDRRGDRDLATPNTPAMQTGNGPLSRICTPAYGPVPSREASPKPLGEGRATGKEECDYILVRKRLRPYEVPLSVQTERRAAESSRDPLDFKELEKATRLARNWGKSPPLKQGHGNREEFGLRSSSRGPERARHHFRVKCMEKFGLGTQTDRSDISSFSNLGVPNNGIIPKRRYNAFRSPTKRTLAM
ncbi:hypothetical protein CYMTET_30641 [Cymbomonas tetramitiformis]|uniref:Uncharacterized protein n=1 Tax=Cymbomonas tetramitiformis TaxID=36881 RepID=A0AAE0FIW8_9CHLO|nr:hypothetical protein CYMTET_30641 [Cymbomonas tetramitiformis]